MEISEQIRMAFLMEPEPVHPKSFRFLGVDPLPEAGIATDLSKRSFRHLTSDSRIFVVGYDCPNLEREEYTAWEDFMTQACRLGCSFDYYLGKEPEKSIGRFQRICESSHAKRGQLRVFVKDRTGSEEAELYAKQWERFHFTVFESPRQLWIETCHPEGDSRAYNCFYVPPDIAESEPFLDLCKMRFDKVVSECASLRFES